MKVTPLLQTTQCFVSKKQARPLDQPGNVTRSSVGTDVETLVKTLGLAHNRCLRNIHLMNGILLMSTLLRKGPYLRQKLELV